MSLQLKVNDSLVNVEFEGSGCDHSETAAERKGSVTAEKGLLKSRGHSDNQTLLRPNFVITPCFSCCQMARGKCLTICL